MTVAELIRQLETLPKDFNVQAATGMGGRDDQYVLVCVYADATGALMGIEKTAWIDIKSTDDEE